MSEQNGVQSLLDQHPPPLPADFLSSQAPPHPVVSTVRPPNPTVIVAAFPPLPDHDAPDLTECDQAILTLLAGRIINVPARRIRNELETRGLYVCSLDTIKRSLRKLKALPLVVNS